MEGYIYKIENKINKKVYIGKTEQLNPMTRWTDHKREATKNRYIKKGLYRAIRKYGIDNFIFTILEKCNPGNINDKEQEYIKLYKSNKNKYGYNQTVGGDGRQFYYPEEKIVKEYLTGNAIYLIGIKYKIAPETISKILVNNEIKIISSGDRMRVKIGKKVVLLDNEKKLEFLCICDAARYLQKQKKTIEPLASKIAGKISLACRGKRRSAYGYKWKFI